LITDSSDTAKQINYERGNAVKCVTLDGTVFHKAGLITGGGMVNDGGKRWEEKECEGLKKVREGLLAQMMEIRGERRTGGSGDAVRERFSGLGREIRDLKDDLVRNME
jgi:structural maintenance of chromosome 1